MAWIVLHLNHKQGSSHPATLRDLLQEYAANFRAPLQQCIFLCTWIILPHCMPNEDTVSSLEVCWSVQLPAAGSERIHRTIHFHVIFFWSRFLGCQLAILYPALFLSLPIHEDPGQISFLVYIANLSWSHLSVNSYSPTDSFPSVCKHMHFSCPKNNHSWVLHPLIY